MTTLWPGSQASAIARVRPSIDQGSGRLGMAIAFGSVAIFAPDIPHIRGGVERLVDDPNAGSGAASAPAAISRAAPATAPAAVCGQPDSMSAITSGAFMGGKSMGDYYPDLSGRGYWDHGGAAGPFDTGHRAGANVQLVGTIAASCDPRNFQFAQTVKYKRLILDGVHDPAEGTTVDDIAKSGRDFSLAPARQVWAGPMQFVSMADPPSLLYDGITTAEWDREFVTSLVGPSGRRSVTWSTSIRVAAGAVTKNSVA